MHHGHHRHHRSTRFLYLGALGVGLAAVTSGCFHGRHWGHDEGDPEAVSKRVDRAMDRLDVTDAQREQIEPIALQMASELVDLRQRTQRLRRAAMVQWKASTPDAALLHQQVDQDIEAVRQSMHRLVDQAVTVHNTLTQEQREEVASAAERFERWRR
jgi:Spy/CpxP family protein refolding chaperone